MLRPAVAADLPAIAAVQHAFCERNLLDTLFTDPRVWGQGHGRALLRDAEEAMSTAGYERASLWTEERNHRPLRVYAEAGWLADGATREREWAGTTIRELRLTKRLRS